MNVEDLFSNITEEQKAKARACTTPEELIALAKAEGIELSDEQLEGVGGGSDWQCWNNCTGDCPGACCVCPTVGVCGVVF